MMPKLDADMTSANTSACRIYIGNLSLTVTSEELYEVFKVYGVIVGMKYNRNGYGFIQFEDESSATEAITNNKKIEMGGKMVLVKTAMNKKNNPNTNTNTNIREQSEQDDMANDNDYADEDQEAGSSNWQRGGRGMRGFHNNPRHQASQGYRDRSPHARGDWQDRVPYERYPVTDREPYRTVVPDKNDCEIIVVSKILTEYAEYIEDRLKRIGLTVDLLFPNEDVPIGRVLGNISSRGCLYAILVMPQNEEHRSFTLNILHGLPQEHRNMPLEDAITLMARNYAEYQRSGGASSKESVLLLVRELGEGRPLTVLQYDTVLQYVKECREKQVKVELGSAAVEQTSVKTQVDLEQRIMSILNSGRAAAAEASAADKTGSGGMGSFSLEALAQRTGGLPQPVPAPKGSAPILSNPTVQRALDSLLKNIM